ncbi:MAG: response regulator [Ferruginibacter sp.]
MRKESVLLVEDDLDDIEIFQEALTECKLDIDLTIARNGKEALQKMDVNPPYKAIFLDLNMPVMNGYQFLEELHKSGRITGNTIIILTTSSSEVDKKITKELGAVDFITKGNSYVHYCEVIKKAITSTIYSFE